MPWTDALYFSSVTTASRGVAGWSNVNNAGGSSEPDDSDYASTSVVSSTNWLVFYNPKCADQVPGSIDTTVFLNLEVQIRGVTVDDTDGDFRLDTYGFTDGSDFLVRSIFGTTIETKTYNKSIASWGLTQAEVWDFLLSGSSSHAFRWYADRSGATGIVPGRCHWALCRVEYTYTPLPGSGIILGKL